MLARELFFLRVTGFFLFTRDWLVFFFGGCCDQLEFFAVAYRVGVLCLFVLGVSRPCYESSN